MCLKGVAIDDTEVNGASHAGVTARQLLTSIEARRGGVYRVEARVVTSNVPTTPFNCEARIVNGRSFGILPVWLFLGAASTPAMNDPFTIYAKMNEGESFGLFAIATDGVTYNATLSMTLISHEKDC